MIVESNFQNCIVFKSIILQIDSSNSIFYGTVAQYLNWQVGTSSNLYKKKFPQCLISILVDQLHLLEYQWKQTVLFTHCPVLVGCGPFNQPVEWVPQRLFDIEFSDNWVPAGNINRYHPIKYLIL